MAAATLSPQDVYIYGLDTEADDPSSPYFDERVHYPLDPAKVQNVLALGVLVPILLVKAKGNEAGDEIPKGAWIVADGRQRVRQAREANDRLEKLGEPLIRLDYVVKDGSEDQIAAMGVATNENRTDDSLTVKAAKAARLKARGYSTEEVAIHFATTPQTIRNWLKLDALPTLLKRETEAGRVTMTDALKLGKAENVKEALAEHKATQETKSAAKPKGSRGTPTRARAPEKKWRVAMALDEGTKLAAPVHYMIQWLVGQCSTEEAEKYIPGFKASLSRAKARVTREEKSEEARSTEIAKAAGQPPQVEETPEPEPEAPAPKAKKKKKAKKAEPEETPEPEAPAPKAKKPRAKKPKAAKAAPEPESRAAAALASLAGNDEDDDW